ncbi:MAG: penicillin-binding protein [Ferruginibacter sp.]|nr:transpeptidase family protein [Ferruginibacter sp.]
MDIKKDILWRVYLCFIGMVILCVGVLSRAIYIQQAQGKYWRGMSDSLHIKSQPINAERGTIYSEDGNMLSTSVPIFDVFVDFGAEGLREKGGKRFKENIDSLSICLSNLFGDKSIADYHTILQHAYNEEDRYFILKKKMTFDQYLLMRKFPLVRLGRNKSGFIIDAKDKRINPYVLLANRTIGLSRQDLSKNVGLELTYDSLLRGTTGQRLMRYAAGAYMPVEGSELDPVNGKDIITTLDTYIQDVTENALLKMMANNNSLHGTAIVMETATGKIKAIANLGKQADGTYLEDMNYGIGKKTEPGSVFKLATLMSLLEDGFVDTNTVVNCEGGRKSFYGLRITDSHLGTYETTVKNAFAASSNVAFAKLADQFYHNNPQKFLDNLHKMRLDTYTGVDIVASSGFPLIKKATARSWSATTIPYMAHGYEELVTPLHMLTLYNAVANNGKMMKPYLVNAIKEYGVTVKEIQPQVLVSKVCSDVNVAKLKACMLDVVESKHGTAHAIKDSNYLIAGKTGTAVTALDNKGYNKGAKIYQASFIGYFPASAPKYTVAVVIQNSRESKLIYGAAVSGTVFKEISDKLMARYISTTTQYKNTVVKDSIIINAIGLKKDVQSVFSFMQIPFADSAKSGTWRNVMLLQNNIAMVAAPAYSNNTMPNVIGMGLKDAVYLLENNGIKISLQGKGKVISQSIIAGTNFKKGQKINLFLN